MSVLFIFISYLYMFFYLDHNAQNCQAVVRLKAGLEDRDSEGASTFYKCPEPGPQLCRSTVKTVLSN